MYVRVTDLMLEVLNQLDKTLNMVWFGRKKCMDQ